MEATSPRIRSLLRQAKRTAGVGKRAAARQLYREIVEEAPESVEGWLGLARVAADAQERESAYRRVLELDPENEAALKALRGEGEGERSAKSAAEPSPAEAESDPFEATRAWLEEATGRKAAGVDGQGAKTPATEEASAVEEAPDKALSDVASPAESTTSTIEGGAVETAGEQEAMVCYRHPSRETGLRCAQCNRPICSKCAIHTPVGYRCPQCIREREDVFYTANVLDYLLAGVAALVLGVLAGLFVPRLGFFVIFVGPFAGTLIGRVAFRAARRHHGRWLPHLVAAMVVFGALLPLFDVLVGLLFGQINLFRLLWPAIYVFMATGAAYYQVK